MVEASEVANMARSNSPAGSWIDVQGKPADTLSCYDNNARRSLTHAWRQLLSVSSLVGAVLVRDLPRQTAHDSNFPAGGMSC